ncbi:MAG: YdcF family protein [Desulfarculaceae bacterium]|nr:YdcF family protein [Desulfarculaceae bacterium]MCF8047362.1 YdcF family protein [Desulfarculaceae bacterium]MCF8063788.1 YdcF family protein [Desulfarculaceae bacterium]MCF8097865.1 YdcF family protein [Desulfarculaceae bacterium]MCF8122433.1 YdcF family protein [Desulfarculaceae bacterium]
MVFIGFIAKKLISRLVLPLGQVLVLWLAGALIWWRRPAKRTGPLLMIIAGLWLLVLSMPITGGLLLHQLESQNWAYATPAALSAKGVSDIVVLAGGYGLGETTAADRLGPRTLKRLLEGVRLWRGMPGAKLVLSGGNIDGESSEAHAMTAMALELGVPKEAIVSENASWDTEDQAELLKQRLDGRPFALVTSAIHMPRSMAWFRGYGLNPVAAPCDFRTKDMRLDFFSFLPSVSALEGCEDAVHEYLGLIWQRLKQALGGAPKEATS